MRQNMCKLVETIEEGNECSHEEIEMQIDRERKQMDCNSGHCSGCPYNG
ncbi:MAG: hypothetical protein PHX61_02395 [Alphaproteobacteria bacterium]|nr:hypothetical protein [Alphaproteobacteria bacterium]